MYVVVVPKRFVTADLSSILFPSHEVGKDVLKFMRFASFNSALRRQKQVNFYARYL